MMIDWLPEKLKGRIFYLPALLDPLTAPVWYFLLLFFAASLTGVLLYFLAGSIYRELGGQQQKTYRLSLLALPALAAFLLYQGGQWGAFSALGLAALASVYWHYRIRWPGELVLLIWAALSGVVLAWGFLVPVLALTGLAFFIVLLTYHYRWHKARFILLIRLEQKTLALVEEKLADLKNRQTGRYYLAGLWELVYQVSLSQVSQELLEELTELAGVRQAVVISRERGRHWSD